MSLRWFRCYSDIKDDPKMLGVSDADFRVWIHLLALVADEGEGGVLPAFSEKGIAATLRTTVGRWRAALAIFVSLGMVSAEPLTITNWSKRQFISDNSTPRSQRSRNGHATLLQRPQSTESETESETDNHLMSARVWFKKLTGKEPSNPVMRETLLNLDAAHPPECLKWAFEKSAKADDPWTYSKRILDSCLIEGHSHERQSRATTTRPRQGHPATAGRSGQVRRTSDFD